MRARTVWHSFRYAVRGVLHTLRTERNARIHAVAACIVYFCAWYFDFSLIEYAILTLTVGAVWSAEIFNTAIEALVDLTSPERHPLARIAKDTAAGAVLVTALLAAIVGCLLFWPKITG